MKRNLITALLLIAAGSINAVADITVDKSNGVVTITSDISGIVFAKVVDPNDKVIVDRRYEGNSFTWTPSGPDGAYRYDVHIVEAKTPDLEESGGEEQSDGSGASDYAGGSVEVLDGQIEDKANYSETNKGKANENE